MRSLAVRFREKSPNQTIHFISSIPILLQSCKGYITRTSLTSQSPPPELDRSGHVRPSLISHAECRLLPPTAHMASHPTGKSGPRKSGIETTADGSSYIPASKRADGSTRKEIRVRPGYRPPEDVETYKNRSAEAWKNRGLGGIPGADPITPAKDEGAAKSKNAKRRDAARRKAAVGLLDVGEDEITSAMQKTDLSEIDKRKKDWRDPSKLVGNEPAAADLEDELDQQKKIRNQLKKLRAVRELREKRAAGEKLSHDQIMKIGKEGELLRDLKKLGYDGPELQGETCEPVSGTASSTT